MDTDSLLKRIIRETAEDLAESVYNLTGIIPDETIYELKSRLLRSMDEFPDKLESTLADEKNLRSIIKANVLLGEIKDYLKLADELHYTNADDLIEKVSSVSRLITTGYPFLAV